MKADYYKLTDDDKEAIENHQKTFEKIDDIGFRLLDECLSDDVIDDYLIPIRSLLYRVLELNDTFSVMVENSLINTIFPLVRSEFELVVQIHYILCDTSSIENKAMLYHYCGIRSQVPKDSLGEFNIKMQSSKHFSDLHKKTQRIKNNERLSWYSLFEGKRVTFKNLCEKTNFKEHYDALYPHLSSDSHGNSCIELNTVCFTEGGQYYLRHFRHFERHHTAMTLHIIFMSSLFQAFKENFIKQSDLIDQIDCFHSKSLPYVKFYWETKGTILDSTPHYSI